MEDQHKPIANNVKYCDSLNRLDVQSIAAERSGCDNLRDASWRQLPEDITRCLGLKYFPGPSFPKKSWDTSQVSCCSGEGAPAVSEWSE